MGGNAANFCYICGAVRGAGLTGPLTAKMPEGAWRRKPYPLGSVWPKPSPEGLPPKEYGSHSHNLEGWHSHTPQRRVANQATPKKRMRTVT